MKKLILLIIFLIIYQSSFSQINSDYDKLTIRNDLLLNNSNQLFEESKLSFYNNQEKKSIGLAAILSLLLPGMGELYVGDYSTGRYFTASEGLLWMGYISIDLYGTWVRDDARRFASLNAGVTLAGQDDNFYTDIGNYSDVFYYNERKLQERQIDNIYDPNSVKYWKWENESDRLKYRNLRIRSDEAFNSLQFVLGAVLVNHIVSAINAARLANIHNKKSSSSEILEIDSKIIGSYDSPHFVLRFKKTF